MRKIITAALWCLIASCMLFQSMASGETRMLWKSENTGSPQIHNGWVVWQSHDGKDSEIYLWDSANIHQITDNGYDDEGPQIHNGQVAWSGNSFGDYWQIFLWNKYNTQQITNSNLRNERVQINNGQLVWQGQDITNIYRSGIYFFNGKEVRDIPNQKDWNRRPQIHNGKVVWEGGDWWMDILIWDGLRTEQLTYGDRYLSSLLPQIDNGLVVWVGQTYSGSAMDIFLWDGSSIRQITNNNTRPDENPQIHNNQIVWEHRDGVNVLSDKEIYFWDGFITRPLTNNNYQDTSPQIHNGQVVWSGFDGNDYEIFYYNGSAVKPLTKNTYDDREPQIDNGQVVWKNETGVFFWSGCTSVNGSVDYCRDCGLCGIGEGDCDGDYECQEGLICAQDVGANYAMPWNYDVCEQPAGGCTLPVGHLDYCSDPSCGPCAVGEGDCDNDGECESGLTCVQVTGTDYCQAGGGCTLPAGHLDYCADPNCGPCDEGEGDCDNDSECLGDLTCPQVSGTDYCQSSPCPPVGHLDYCLECGPCAAGEGDCDSDSECQSGLTCIQVTGTDVCCSHPLGHLDYCRDCGPCAAGQGDCDNDSECAGDLTCPQVPGTDTCQ